MRTDTVALPGAHAARKLSTLPVSFDPPSAVAECSGGVAPRPARRRRTPQHEQNAVAPLSFLTRTPPAHMPTLRNPASRAAAAWRRCRAKRVASAPRRAGAGGIVVLHGIRPAPAGSYPIRRRGAPSAGCVRVGGRLGAFTAVVIHCVSFGCAEYATSVMTVIA